MIYFILYGIRIFKYFDKEVEAVKLNVENTLERLFFLTLSDFPVNWLESGFQSKFSQFQKLDCIDRFYKVFYPEFSGILEKKGKSVYGYIKEKPYSEYPLVEGKPMNQMRFHEYVNKLWNVLRKKFEDGDKQVKELLEELRIVEKGNLPFEDIKPAIAWRPITFLRNPRNLNKGTNLLIVLLALIGIRKGDITGEGTKALERTIEIYACFSSEYLGLELQEIWKKLCRIYNVSAPLGFECEY